MREAYRGLEENFKDVVALADQKLASERAVADSLLLENGGLKKRVSELEAANEALVVHQRQSETLRRPGELLTPSMKLRSTRIPGSPLYSTPKPENENDQVFSALNFFGQLTGLRLTQKNAHCWQCELSHPPESRRLVFEIDTHFPKTPAPPATPDQQAEQGYCVHYRVVAHENVEMEHHTLLESFDVDTAELPLVVGSLLTDFYKQCF
eukprot:TRINITY_DN5193_c0_g2_i2.p1 TRINITY_DN5193_c0_g2~~TRINITY_DN5193_c0_g2_i2.p1  ORF type:complete len:238 (+),score=59.27 TRINITY_DN5193_c0_g2_i2:88-714(+)